MKCNKIICLFVVFLVVCSLFSLSVFAADEAASTEGTEVAAAAEEITQPTTNIYYIINGMWKFFFPAQVIEDNAGVFAFYNIGLTTLFILAPFIVIFKFLFRKK